MKRSKNDKDEEFEPFTAAEGSDSIPHETPLPQKGAEPPVFERQAVSSSPFDTSECGPLSAASDDLFSDSYRSFNAWTPADARATSAAKTFPHSKETCLVSGRKGNGHYESSKMAQASEVTEKDP